MNRIEGRNLLLQAADSAYKEFNDKLTKCDTHPSIGVRVPKIRKIAGEIIKSGWKQYLEEMEALFGRKAEPELLQEEHMLWGIVIGGARMEAEERRLHLNRWVPEILSWADCDCSVSGMKFMKKNQEFWFTYNMGWLRAGGMDGQETPSVQPFAVRFALVALMQYYINDEYIDRVLEIFAFPFPAADYYIRMAQAWALSVCFVKYRNRTLQLLEEKRLDAWVQNKAIQKCRESYRVSAEDKKRLEALKV